MATKLEQYAEIQGLVRKEIETMFPQLYSQQATKYGVAKVPLHVHNGFDAPQIKQSNIIQSQAASGSITMSTNGQRYEIGLNIKPGSPFTPSTIRFNGIAVHSTTSPAITPDIRSLVCGDAFLGPSFYLQPESSSSVTIGGNPQVVIQSSSYILVNNSGAGPATQASVSEGHIVSVTFNGNIVARATIPDQDQYGAIDGPIKDGNLLVDVTLATNWHIIGNFVIM